MIDIVALGEMLIDMFPAEIEREIYNPAFPNPRPQSTWCRGAIYNPAFTNASGSFSAKRVRR